MFKIQNILSLGMFTLIISCGSAPQGGAQESSEVKISHDGNYQQVNKIAVIIEPRKHELLVPIVKNAMTVLGSDWKIQIFHGTGNLAFVTESELRDDIASGRILMSSLGVHNISQPEYSRLLLTSYFWENVFGEIVLIFQTDSILCGASTKKIEHFLKYDYIGAPHSDHSVGCYIYEDHNSYIIISNRDADENKLKALGAQKIQSHSTFVGNGGLSLRKRSKTLDVLKKFKIGGSFLWGAEDDYYSCLAQDSRSGMSSADLETAKRFSIGGIYHPDAFGVHQPWTFLTKEEIQKLSESCVEYSEILRPFYRKREQS